MKTEVIVGISVTAGAILLGAVAGATYYYWRHSRRCQRPSGENTSLIAPVTSKPDESMPQNRRKPYEASPKPRSKPKPALTTLADYGYCFHGDKLVKTTDKKSGFTFVDQEQYEAMGGLVDEEVFRMLEDRCHLVRLRVPNNSAEPHTFIFASANWKTSEKLLVLIHGSGVVRAGQWTRKLIINDSVKSGTQIPYIERAQKLGYAVMVLNTNDNRRGGVSIQQSRSPEEHGEYVWNTYIQSAECQVKHIAIVAHSYGGVVVLNMLERARDFQKKVFAIGFTDSVHSSRLQSEKQRYFKRVAKNWVTSAAPVGTELGHSRGDCPLASAGTTDHIWTSHCAIDKVFDFIMEKDPDPQSVPAVSDDEIDLQLQEVEDDDGMVVVEKPEETPAQTNQNENTKQEGTEGSEKNSAGVKSGEKRKERREAEKDTEPTVPVKEPRTHEEF